MYCFLLTTADPASASQVKTHGHTPAKQAQVHDARAFYFGVGCLLLVVVVFFVFAFVFVFTMLRAKCSAVAVTLDLRCSMFTVHYCIYHPLICHYHFHYHPRSYAKTVTLSSTPDPIFRSSLFENFWFSFSFLERTCLMFL